MIGGQAGSWWNRIARRVLGAVQILTYAVCAFGLVTVLDLHARLVPLAVAPIVMALVFATAMLTVAVHEIGHASAAALMGWRVSVIAVSGLTVWPQPLRFHLGVPAFGGFGGGILAVPPREGAWRRQYSLLMLGGPLGNFALAALALLLLTAAPGGPIWHRYLEVAALLSAAMGLLNLVPFVTLRGGTSDGKKALDALRGKDLEPFGHETRLFEEVVNCKPPPAWDPALIRDIESDVAAGRNSATGDMLLYSLALSRRQFPAARAALARAVKKLGPIDTLKVEEAFLKAYVDRDAAAAAQMLSRMSRRRLRGYSNYWRALGAAQILTGKTADAARSLKKARSLLKRMPFTTAHDFEGIAAIERLAPTAEPQAA